ncbi:MAG: hypothetical protein IJV04_01315 [Lachnospiraceae bacterium]|nr:hypothetical protein [Lachnospiraceae bacterium]
MKIIKQDRNVRLVQTIGRYMEYRYEVQEIYFYFEHRDDESPTAAWGMKCYSHDLKRAEEMYETHRRAQV